MKIEKASLLTAIFFLIACCISLLFSCSQDISMDSSSNSQDKSSASIRIYLENEFNYKSFDCYGDNNSSAFSVSRKSAMPESLDKNALEYILLGTDETNNSKVLAEFGKYSSISGSVINIKKGKWLLELRALRDGNIVLRDEVVSEILSGENVISFNLKNVSEGNGNIDFNLYFEISKYNKVSTKLINLVNNELVSETNLNLSYTNTIYIDNLEYQHCQYQEQDIPCGYYILNFFLYSEKNSNEYDFCYSTFVKVLPFLASRGNDTITPSAEIELKVPISEIKVISAPSKTIYYEGEYLDLSGLEVRVFYKNGDEKVIGTYQTSILDGEKLSVNDNSVSICYGEFNTKFDITVIPNSVNGIIVDISEIEQNIENLLEFSSTSNTFTAKEGFKEYNWWINDYKVQNNMRYLQMDTLQKDYREYLKEGHNTLLLNAVDVKGVNYSSSAEFVIIKDSVSFISVRIGEITEKEDLINLDLDVFKANLTYASYIWLVDDKIVSKSSQVKIDNSYSGGNHTITLIVKDNNGYYFSQTVNFLLKKDTEKDSDITKITITINEYSNKDNLIQFDLNNLSVRAQKGFSSYCWFVDNEIIESARNSSVLSLKTTDSGNHTILLIVSDFDGNFYSKAISVVISGDLKKEDSSITKIFIVIPEYKDGALFIPSNNKNTLNAKSGYKSYKWWIDGDLFLEDLKLLNLKLLASKKGNHTIMLVAEDFNNQIYSQTIEIVVI